MLKFYKKILSEYQFADILQTVSLVLFVIFFVLLVWYVYSRPKGFYQEVSELPLEDDFNETSKNK